MELLSGLSQEMGDRIHRPVELSDLMELMLPQNVKDSRHEVCQAYFTLLGHLVNASLELVNTHLGSMRVIQFFFG